MITCTLGDKKYSVDFVSGRALREIDDAMKMYMTVVQASASAANDNPVSEKAQSIKTKDALDVMVKWFCVLFGNQFTPDDMYDYYPADRIMYDISLALFAVQTQATDILKEFPTQPTAEKKKRAK